MFSVYVNILYFGNQEPKKVELTSVQGNKKDAEEDIKKYLDNYVAKSVIVSYEILKIKEYGE